jgi:hypothetical protein
MVETQAAREISPFDSMGVLVRFLGSPLWNRAFSWRDLADICNLQLYLAASLRTHRERLRRKAAYGVARLGAKRKAGAELAATAGPAFLLRSLIIQVDNKNLPQSKKAKFIKLPSGCALVFRGR